MNEHATAIRSASLSPKWIKAAAIGSIWAAIEIVAGSFLHNLRIPFSGTMHSRAAVYMLVAFAMQWKESGIIIRAGLIAALMKSISPSAVILGPMAGIIMEAVILEGILLLLGRNIAGSIIAGMLAVTWALAQKIISLLILYGFDLVRIAEAFYLFLVKSTGLEDLSPLYLVTLVIAIYLAAGTAAALAGTFSFRQLQKKSLQKTDSAPFETSKRLPFGARPEIQKYAAFNLLAILTILAVTLYMLNAKHYLPALITGGILITGVLIRYSRAIHYLKKPSLWIQLLIITLLASLLWEWFSTGKLFSAEGLVVGLEISFRALVIIFSFAAISVEMRNPLVRSLLYRNGFANLYRAVSMAFSVLPGIIERIPRNSNLFRQRRSILHTILQLAEELVGVLQNNAAPHLNIIILTGQVQGGKTSLLQSLIKNHLERQLSIAGFIAEGTFNNGRREEFTLTDIRTSATIPLAGRKKMTGWVRHRSFYFNPDALHKGEEILSDGMQDGADLLVIDEVGPVELSGGGWSRILGEMEKEYHTPQIWVVRERILREVKDHWQIPEQNIYHAETADMERIVEHIFRIKEKMYD